MGYAADTIISLLAEKLYLKADKAIATLESYCLKVFGYAPILATLNSTEADSEIRHRYSIKVKFNTLDDTRHLAQLQNVLFYFTKVQEQLKTKLSSIMMCIALDEEANSLNVTFWVVEVR